ncbi:HAD family hydrolase [Flexithrix dorotheae]|uniref:HAD family hydrolase n=1 Tax=Flexithrix dorotheae TaxID=70993 RepID=UPI00036B6236|nr:beta-phosphoglucomutase family hydrolase [Flexithrix dorotheae]
MDKLQISPKAKALIFDLDGTLADTMPTHYLSWQKVAEKYGFEFDENWFYELGGVPTKQITVLINERYNLTLDPIKIEEEKEGYYLELEKDVQPILPVVGILNEYKDKMPISCGTGNIREIALPTLENIGLGGVFKILVTAEDVKHPKPSPETFLKCAEQMGVEPEFCQVFEDGNPGLQAAREAGMIPTDVRPFLK